MIRALVLIALHCGLICEKKKAKIFDQWKLIKQPIMAQNFGNTYTLVERLPSCITRKVSQQEPLNLLRRSRNPKGKTLILVLCVKFTIFNFETNAIYITNTQWLMLQIAYCVVAMATFCLQQNISTPEFCCCLLLSWSLVVIYDSESASLVMSDLRYK